MPRPIRRVFTTPRFTRSFGALPAPVRQAAALRDQWFRADAFDPRLKTHSLKGLWSYSLDRRHRILFEFLAAEEVLYHDVGTHAVYR